MLAFSFSGRDANSRCINVFSANRDVNLQFINVLCSFFFRFTEGIQLAFN